jgi:hypothetical protein
VRGRRIAAAVCHSPREFWKLLAKVIEIFTQPDSHVAYRRQRFFLRG